MPRWDDKLSFATITLVAAAPSDTILCSVKFNFIPSAEGIKLNFTEHRIVSEGAAATSVMVAKDNLSSHLGKNIICLICGGNIEKNLFKKIISWH